jgi:hypothetical protein
MYSEVLIYHYPDKFAPNIRRIDSILYRRKLLELGTAIADYVLVKILIVRLVTRDF